MKKFLICSDIHGSLLDEGATEGCLAFTKDFAPEIRVIAGDLWDFAAIRKGASEDEKSLSMGADFEAGARFAKRFYEGGAENHLMMGNHDVRVWDLAASCNAVHADLGARMVTDIKVLAASCNARLVPYDARTGVVSIGHLNIVHGFFTGMSACAAHSRVYGNVVFGHIHSIESFQVPGLDQKEARSIGCLCDLNPDYANRKTGKLRWAHGFAYGFLFDDGTYQIHQARRIDGRFYLSSDVKAY